LYKHEFCEDQNVESLTTLRSLISICAVHSSQPVWVKYNISDLHVMPLSNYFMKLIEMKTLLLLRDYMKFCS